jgi:ADP-dependent NAD(P)H-hydrate dehydratase / NAD(P)H-hydrate epimerase
LKKVFADVKTLEKEAERRYGLSEDVMIENAAMALEKCVRRFASDEKLSSKNTVVLIACGGGNNGADGYALARRLQRVFIPVVHAVEVPKSASCKKQAEAAANAEVVFEKPESQEYLLQSSIVVDCIYGTGFHGILSKNAENYISFMNKHTDRIACDIPSGIDRNGEIHTVDACGKRFAFEADATVTMGAYKTALFSDAAKAHCGRIFCGSIGVEEDLLTEGHEPDLCLLEKNDAVLPLRTDCSAHKGTFGHVSVVTGEKPGAAVLAGTAAFTFGAGLVTLVDTVQNRRNMVQLPPELMCADIFPSNTTAVLFGSGFGRTMKLNEQFDVVSAWLDGKKNGGLVLDADAFYYADICTFLEKSAVRWPEARLILTPHPKEFQSLLSLCGESVPGVDGIVDSRIELTALFEKRFPNVVLVLKGANTIIAEAGKQYISTEGCVSLAKAGSGDVLAGMICSLLAQGYSAGEAARSGVLAHGIASQQFGSSFGMTPLTLIEAVPRICLS